MLASILFVFACTVVVLWADFKISGRNMGAKWNGIGCIPDILNRRAMLPMRHRVLVPWVCGLLVGWREEWGRYITAYFSLRWVSVFAALFMAWVYFAFRGVDPFIATALLSLFFVLASLYDYTDVYIELAVMALALILVPMQFAWVPFVLAGLMFIGALNRETIFVIPAVVLVGGNYLLGFIMALAALCGWIVPRLVYGSAERYCPFNMIGENFRRFSASISKGPYIYNGYVHFGLLAMLSGYLWITEGSLLSIDYVMAIYMVAIMVPSVWSEIRVFAPVMLSVIPLIVGRL